MKTLPRLSVLFSLALLTLSGCAADAGVDDDDLADEDSSLSTTNEAAVTPGGFQVVAHFVNPDHGPKGVDTTATDEVKRLVLSAPRGATIRVAIFHIGLMDVAKALVKAQDDNGVDVQVVADGQIEDKTAVATYLRQHLKSLHACGEASGGHGCIPRDKDGIMHGKWMTLSQAKDASGALHAHVSWLGSANLTEATGQASFNNTITVYDDQALYDGFGGYFQDLTSQKHYAGDDYYDASRGRGYFRSPTAAVFASPEQDTDLVEARLNDITPTKDCVVRVAQASFHDSRKNLAALLAKQKKGGCKVGVVVGEDKAGVPDIGPEALRILRQAKITVRSRDHIHSKLVLVHAESGGQMRDVVYTGSHNFTKLALRQDDEIFVRMADDPALFHAFVGHFNDQYRSAQKVK